MTPKHENEKAAEEFSDSIDDDKYFRLYSNSQTSGWLDIYEASRVAFLAGCASERERIWAAVQAEVTYYGPGFMESIGVEHLKGIIFGRDKE